MTERGLSALRAELAQEQQRRHGSLQASADARESTEQLARLAQLESRLATAVLVDKLHQPRGEVRFGASVTLRSASGAQRRYRIVGVDEADAARGDIAFVAPLARSLLGKRVGDAALIAAPGGEDELEVMTIEYE